MANASNLSHKIESSYFTDTRKQVAEEGRKKIFSNYRKESSADED